MATSHLYHDSYFCRFRSVNKLRLLLVTFCLWLVVVEVATLLFLVLKIQTYCWAS